MRHLVAELAEVDGIGVSTYRHPQVALRIPIAGLHRRGIHAVPARHGSLRDRVENEERPRPRLATHRYTAAIVAEGHHGRMGTTQLFGDR